MYPRCWGLISAADEMDRSERWEYMEEELLSEPEASLDKDLPFGTELSVLPPTVLGATSCISGGTNAPSILPPWGTRLVHSWPGWKAGPPRSLMCTIPKFNRKPRLPPPRQTPTLQPPPDPLALGNGNDNLPA